MNIEKEGELFEQWWEDEGQYHRAGGNEYCKTFAWESWIAAKSQVVPEGFVVVPKEPTYEMLEVGSEARSLTEGHISSIWEAMIEVALKKSK